MKNITILEEIERLRKEMVKYYLHKDMDNAVKISQQLDKMIYEYLRTTQAIAAGGSS